jgi:hypothetical protein
MSVKYIIDQNGHKTGVILDIDDYNALIKQKKEVKEIALDPDKDPILTVLGSVKYGNLTKDIDNALYGD